MAAWALIVAMPAMAAIATWNAPRWIFMWSLAFAIYVGLKWLTFVDSRVRRQAPLARQWAYLFLWCGMNADAFLAPGKAETAGRSNVGRYREWLLAMANVGLGIAVIFAGVRWLEPWGRLWAGWAGIVGLGLILHFGALKLIALGWQSAGFSATPLMNSPGRSQSLAEFWGRRWNTAFRDLAHRYVFRPLLRRVGPHWAMLAVFATSGVVHEIVITPAAGGGYGLPTLYFLLQAAAVAAEKSNFGKRLGLDAGWRGRVFCLALVLLPAGLCFPPAFVERVIWPMLQAMGAV